MHLKAIILRIFREPSWARSILGTAENARNHGNNRKFHKSDQTLNQTKGDIDKLRLGKI